MKLSAVLITYLLSFTAFAGGGHRLGISLTCGVQYYPELEVKLSFGSNMEVDRYIDISIEQGNSFSYSERFIPTASTTFEQPGDGRLFVKDERLKNPGDIRGEEIHTTQLRLKPSRDEILTGYLWLHRNTLQNPDLNFGRVAKFRFVDKIFCSRSF